MVKGARQREWPRHLSTHTHTHWTLPTTMSVLETPFDIHVSSVYQTHTCMQAPIPTLCISAKKTHNKGSRTRPIMSTLMPRSGIPVICSRATLSCDSSYFNIHVYYIVCFSGPGSFSSTANTTSASSSYSQQVGSLYVLVFVISYVLYAQWVILGDILCTRVLMYY